MKKADVRNVGDNYIIARYENIDRTLKRLCVACKNCNNIIFIVKNNDLPLYCSKCQTIFNYIPKEDK